MVMLKAYLKRVVGYLKENGKEDRVKGFQAGATEMVKFIIGKLLHNPVEILFLFFCFRSQILNPNLFI